MAEPVALDPFSVPIDLGGPLARRIVFHHREDAQGQAHARAVVLDARGRVLAEVPGLADLVAWPEGRVAGLRLNATGTRLTAFVQPASAVVPTPTLESAPFTRLDLPRLERLGNGQAVVCGAEYNTLALRTGVLDAGATLGAVVLINDMSDPVSGTAIGLLVPVNGIGVVGDTLFIGGTSSSLPATEGWAPLGHEISPPWTSRRLVEALPEVSDGFVRWRTSAVIAWREAFWIAATRSTPRHESHRLYRLPPGGAPVLVLETGGASALDTTPQPWGVMIQAPEALGLPSPGARRGGLWPGTRLVAGAVPTRVVTGTGSFVSSTPAGVLVLEDTGAAPLFHALPDGLSLDGAHCLADPDASSRESLWLACLRDATGTLHAALTRDFQAWTLDPAGVDIPPADATTVSRWGRLGAWPG
ncbi:hypothetical protein [Pararhodospirillum oryzae]|uniref:Uncharacterized protein n=1 Tax=Pararhodospirillum oryzae TaxID=478448 RepID=A0A512H4P8_9PROT|nr:hypothetical protein [Pararhodospirillum oryzae]GEO80436.1 hypothetical protein ROR02_05670 [Pararhodospirillum oryzae]